MFDFGVFVQRGQVEVRWCLSKKRKTYMVWHDMLLCLFVAAKVSKQTQQTTRRSVVPKKNKYWRCASRYTAPPFLVFDNSYDDPTNNSFSGGGRIAKIQEKENSGREEEPFYRPPSSNIYLF